MNKRLILIYSILFIFIVGLGIGGFYYYHQQTNFISTEDSKVTGDIVPISSDAQGKLTEWTVKIGDKVKKGDKLGKVTVNNKTIEIQAQENGTIIKNTANVGQLVTPGQTLAQLVDLEKLYISANIEEQEIADVTVGQKVDVMIDAVSETRITGKVQEIGLATNSLFSLFSGENASGNYTKVVQRIPVKIEMKNYPDKIVPGMNATIKIHK